MTMMTADKDVREIDDTLQFEMSLKAQMALAPHMSETKLALAEMLLLCMTYRGLLGNRVSKCIEGEDYGTF